MYPCMQAIMSALHELASTMLTSRSVADSSITCMYPCMQAIMSALHELASTTLTSGSVADSSIRYLYVSVHAGNHERTA